MDDQAGIPVAVNRHLPKKAGVPTPKEIDKSILDARSAPLTTDVITRAQIAGSGGGTFVIGHNGALNLITLRYRLKDLPVRAARNAVKVGEQDFPAGSFIVSGNEARVRKEIGSLGLVAAALNTAPSVETFDVDLPRIAIYTTWANTEKVCWVRLAFDRWEVPFDLIHKDHVKQGNLRGTYDRRAAPGHVGQEPCLRTAEAVQAAAL